MTKKLSKEKSFFFDFLRWSAAIIVVIGHSDMYGNMFYGNNRTGIIKAYTYLSSHAHSAVIVFFVLSGYLIAYSSCHKKERKDYTFKEYFLDRWSRIYSVLLIAIIFTLLIDYAGSFFSRDYLNPEYVPQDHWGLRLFVNVFSLQGIQGYRVQLGTNPALWSIGYEFVYYILFGLISFRHQLFKNKWFFGFVVFLIPFLIGIKMISYFLLWLVGVLSFRLSNRINIKLSGFGLTLLLLGFLLLNHLVSYKNIFNLIQYWNDFMLALYLGALLIFEFTWPSNIVSIKLNSYMAEFSYSLYSFHLPIVFFYYSVMVKSYGFTSDQWQSGLLISAVCLLISRILYYFTEAQRFRYRAFGANLIHMLSNAAS